MQVNKKDLEKSQVEITVELSVEEFSPYIEKGAQKVSEQVKIEGFRPGKVPFDVLKQKVGEMGILEEAAHIAIQKTVDEVVERENKGRQPVGRPEVSITKLAPNNPLEYKITLALLPEVTVGKYKELNLTPEEAKIDDKELERALSDLKEMRAAEKLVDREIKMDDKVVADVHLSLDKVPLEDGHHHDLAVLMGKDYLVKGFDQELLGLKKGEEKEFVLAYPDDHHQKNLAGKNVSFHVAIKGVYERSLMSDDELAIAFNLKDAADLKKALTESLLHEKKHNIDIKNESELISKISEATKFGEFPEVIVESEAKNIMAELEQSVVRQGGKFEDYLKHLKKTREELMLEMMPNAIKRVKAALIIREIAVLEKIFPSDEEILNKIAELKQQYADNADIQKMIAEPEYKTYLRNILTNEKVIAKLKEWNYANTGNQQKG